MKHSNPNRFLISKTGVKVYARAKMITENVIPTQLRLHRKFKDKSSIDVFRKSARPH